MKIIRVGVDLAKNVFQVHGMERNEKAVWRRKLRRENWLKVLQETVEPGCEIGMEACGGAHHWARQLQAQGYTVKLIAPQFVKPYVKSNKNDANDAEAILGSNEPTQYAIRFGEDGGAAGYPGSTPCSLWVDRAAHGEGQSDPRPGSGIWADRA